MNKQNSSKIVVLKNKEGQALRMIQSQKSLLHLVQNKETKRLELVDADFDYQDTHRLLQEVALDKKDTITLRNIGSLTVHHGDEQLEMDAEPLKDREPEFPIMIKWSSSAHGIIVGILVLFAFLAPKKSKNNDETTKTLVTIQLDKKDIPSAPVPPPAVAENKKMAPPPVREQHVPVSKKAIRVVPRTDKTKSLAVNKSSSRRARAGMKQGVSGNGPATFQRLGTLGAISNAIKGSPTGMGSGLRVKGAQGGGGGVGRGAGMGRGNGTMGNGRDSGGGFEQALYGKGLIAGQVGGGGGGFGSGWGNGTRGSGGFGTKGKGGGHEGYGNSKVGGTGVAKFSYPVREEAVIEGGLDREAVDLVVMKNLGQIIYCYELGLQQKSDLRGRVIVDFTINGQGRISSQSIASSSLHSNKVENCMLSKIKTWKFPRPVGGVSVDVNYPFALQRVSQN